jgi:hypothetical protein
MCRAEPDTVARYACQICRFLCVGLVVGLPGAAWAQFPKARSKAFKESLTSDAWRSRRCWVEKDDVRFAPKPIRIHSTGRVVVMRHHEPAERDGKEGFNVEEHVLLRDRQPPCSLSVPEELMVASAVIRFNALVPLPPTKLHRGAVRSVLASRPRDSSEACHAALKGMAGAVGDKYTRYFDPTEVQRVDVLMDGKRRGLGVCCDSRNRIVRIERGSAAQGVLWPGDRSPC